MSNLITFKLNSIQNNHSANNNLLAMISCFISDFYYRQLIHAIQLSLLVQAANVLIQDLDVTMILIAQINLINLMKKTVSLLWAITVYFPMQRRVSMFSLLFWDLLNPSLNTCVYVISGEKIHVTIKTLSSPRYPEHDYRHIFYKVLTFLTRIM